MGASINHISWWFPEDCLTNDMLARQHSELSAEQILARSGVLRRYIAPETTPPSILARKAAEKLFAETQLARETVDALIYCTEGLDFKAPATACLLHHALQLKPSCLSLDVPSGCTGFVNGLLLAKSLLGKNGIHNVLLLTAEATSKVIDPNDLALRMLFGDGASATLICYTEREHIGEFVFGTDGEGSRHLWVERSGMNGPVDQEWLQQNAHIPNRMRHGKMHMSGSDILHFALSRIPQVVRQTLDQNCLQPDAIDLFVFHQASRIILHSLRRKCRIPSEKFWIDLEDGGNTVSSTIPIALQRAQRQGKIGPGSRVMLIGFGIGLSWAATTLEIARTQTQEKTCPSTH